MKRLLTLILTGVLVLGGGAALSAAPAAQTAQAAAATSSVAGVQATVYLVPGEGGSVAGATKLADSDRQALYLDTDAYLAGNEGTDLPVATTTRTGTDGAALAFNGWWTIVDATVTYFEKVPAVTEPTFLYADFRADLSQRKDPVNPPADAEEKVEHYLKIHRAATETDEIIGLFVSATDVSNAEKAGYGGPVQFYNEWFYLSPGDTMEIYISGVYSDRAAGAFLCPQLRNGKQNATLESSGTSSTGSIITKDTITRFRCVAGAEHPYRIYIKFYDGGGTMTVYMERQDKN